LIDGGGNQGGHNNGQSGHKFSPHDKRKVDGSAFRSAGAENTGDISSRAFKETRASAAPYPSWNTATFWS
jgi:hypothetical protein